MSKRSRSSKSNGSYTGGTKDIKPQWLTVNGDLQPAVNQYAVTSFPLPVPRFGVSGRRATVTEILRIEYFCNAANWADVNWGWIGFLDSASFRTTGEACTLVTCAEDAANPQSIAPVMGHTTGASSGLAQQTVDCTDSNGNGILIAGDKLDFVTGSISNIAAGRSQVKILYRMVNVGVQEYVGILQAQSAR